MTTPNDTHLVPLLDKPLPADLDVTGIAREWFSRFAPLVQSGDAAPQIVDLLVDDSFWRDVLAMSWDFRTFRGPTSIKTFLDHRLDVAKLSNLKLEKSSLVQFPPAIGWIQGIFTFEVGDYGLGSGVFRLILTPDGRWKAYTVYTSLTGLKHYPEKAGKLRNQLPNHGKWLEQRQREVEFVDAEPYVVVVGGGHSGLMTAARLKHLDVPTLVLERHDRIGDGWRERYDALCLHDTVWHNEFPYIPYPPSWPVYTPAPKFADWLEFYAQALELNVWTSALVEKVGKDERGRWIVTVRRGGPNGTVRILHPTHVIVAAGYFGKPHVPHFEGKENFKGEVFHTAEFISAKKNVGKKVVIIGCGVSAHDVAADHVENGVGEVTMYQRRPTYVITQKVSTPLFTGPYHEGGPPAAIPDLAGNSLPRLVIRTLLQGLTRYAENLDKGLLDGLAAKGFRYGRGDNDAGFYWMSLVRGGGYYIDVGASQMIVDGKIKMKSDSELDRFTESGLLFKDGSHLEADVIVLATGYGDVREKVCDLFEPEIAAKIKPVWGLDDECEMNSVWRDCGVENLWITLGNISVARSQSIPLALQIKAIKEGIFKGERYSRDCSPPEPVRSRI
ncbi:FAD/NAD(P)-binding domain-containing protein [Thelephora terrestris]|uniref:FAD/NAD(P)-binding domain-containing protein n=1 Tax=Thelephora terrestris TaxID=56493 RepID=A0A9P6L2M8_9AGAM|nr:FAD/NAD(P)-binding domain-containing protein [Thelephora terrestris]